MEFSRNYDFLDFSSFSVNHIVMDILNVVMNIMSIVMTDEKGHLIFSVGWVSMQMFLMNLVT